MNALRLALKSVIEYPLPASSQTHEVAAIRPDLLLISQQPSGALVKMRVDPHSGQPRAAIAHVIDNPFTGLHGLTVSKTHPGRLWVTLQFQSELLLIDPIASDLTTPPEILKRVPLPQLARGPHVVVEDGDILWTSCKDSHHIVRVDSRNPAAATLYPCPPRPIFVQRHPDSGDIYATLDQSSQLYRIPANGGAPAAIEIPAEHGNTPVGMVPGPDGNLWFALLGNASGGNGGFGRIRAGGDIDWFRLSTAPAAGAGFIHLGFTPEAGAEPRLNLLASSMACDSALNGVVQVKMSPDYSRVETQQTIAFPSQHSMSHRVLSTVHGLYATELGACCLAHLRPADNRYGEGVNEMADPYSLWGCGIPETSVRYPGAHREE